MRACERAHAHARAWARGCVAGIKDQHPPTAWYRRHRSHHHQCLAQSAPVWEEICHRKPTPSASPPNPPVHHAELYVCWRVLHVCLLGCQVHSCRNAKTPGALVWKRKNRRSRKTKDGAHATPVSRQVVASDKLWCADKGDWIERAYLGPSLALCLCLKIDLSIPRNILDVAGISSP